jgi:hypothetical protein
VAEVQARRDLGEQIGRFRHERRAAADAQEYAQTGPPRDR